jgi:hypothetical protein
MIDRADRPQTPEAAGHERTPDRAASLREQRRMERVRFERLATRVSALIAAGRRDFPRRPV